jgi:hypothetical protein
MDNFDVIVIIRARTSAVTARALRALVGKDTRTKLGLEQSLEERGAYTHTHTHTRTHTHAHTHTHTAHTHTRTHTRTELGLEQSLEERGARRVCQNRREDPQCQSVVQVHDGCQEVRHRHSRLSVGLCAYCFFWADASVRSRLRPSVNRKVTRRRARMCECV